MNELEMKEEKGQLHLGFRYYKVNCETKDFSEYLEFLGAVNRRYSEQGVIKVYSSYFGDASYVQFTIKEVQE